MDRPVRAVCRAIVALALTMAAGADAQDAPLVKLALPADVSREAALRGDPAAVARLRSIADARLTGAGRARQDAIGLDQLVVWVDRSGAPLQPDREAATRTVAAAGTPPTHLRFTFDSPDDPWSSADRRALRRLLTRCQRIAREIYGDPAFAITVNVRKGNTGPYAGVYTPLLNEITLQPVWQPDTVCHEMVHAFHDDDIALLTTFEEGMTRAMEVEIFNRIEGYQHSFDSHHGFHLDVYFEAENTPAIGSVRGLFSIGAYQLLFLRYQLSGYAWSKAFIENEEFFRNFNRELYARMLVDRTTQGDEVALVAIAAAATATVEGQPLPEWYARQGVFQTSPPLGYDVYYSEGRVEYFRRESSGVEIELPGQTIAWEARDADGGVLVSGTTPTDQFGSADFGPSLGDYSGRFTITASTNSPTGALQTNVVLGPFMPNSGQDLGVMGIVPDRTDGSVVITPLAPAGAPVAVPLVNGAFRAPDLETARGRFEASYTDGSRSVTKVFTKDAAAYFVPLPRVDPTTTTSTTTSTSIPALMIPSTYLLLKDDSDPPIVPAKRGVAFRSTIDPTSVTPPAAGSDGDPTTGGGTLTVSNAAGKPLRFTAPLPAAHWLVRAAGGYRYHDAHQVDGPIKTVLVRDGKVVVSGGGAAWGYPLYDPPQGTVAVRLRLGTQPEWCAVFPAKPASHTADVRDRFLGAPGPAAGSCPPLP